ncbi:hypothetical protein KFL_003530110 [Klebsormidium nitens]|uniref:DM2 domain-containing protein n=1 Tax=Klebsormidium nitens TaxID=105231 RepID=A0A1Y1IH29_KLENI|nr:hypothetical protein KFL_003530110 [Klebsormidium nitens]|eukprot:GAQ87448.1 hypothetical protein KFL_003530110 [Klebsormidium nitens]
MFRAAGVALLRGGGAAVRTATGAAKKAPAEKAARAPTNDALMRKYEVSPALSEFMGAEEVTRQEVTAKIWQHIRTHKLQNPEKKTEVLPDAALRKILDAEVLTFGTISKLLAEHFPKATKPKRLIRGAEVLMTTQESKFLVWYRMTGR